MGRNYTNSTSRQSTVYIAAKSNDEKSMEILRDFWREGGATFLINNRGDTILHFIAIHGNVRALKLLIEEESVNSRDLRVKNENGNTVMHEAARFGQSEIVKMLVGLDREIILERNNKGETPIYVAAMHGEKQVFTSLADNDLCDEFTMTRNDGSTVLHAALTYEFYYFAIELVKMYPEFARKHDKDGWSALSILATKPLSFRSGSIYTIQQMGTAPFLPMQALETFMYFLFSSFGADIFELRVFGKQHLYLYEVVVKYAYNKWALLLFLPLQALETFMYFCIPAMYEESKPNLNLEDPETITKDVIIRRERSSFVNFLLGNAWLGVIDDEKQKHILALTLARRLIKEEDWSSNANNCVKNPLIQATKHGINELIIEIIQNYPQTIETIDEKGKNILHIVVEKKNRFIFDYIMKNVSHIDRLLLDIDQDGKTIIHFAASVGSPFRFSTEEQPIEKTRSFKTLILMAWGVLWFKRVKYCVHPHLWTIKDDKNMTAKELFDRNHSETCKEAERSIKELASSALILSTLLCTINFAAVFTIPGGFDQNSGLPTLLNQPHYSDLWMLMFFIGAALYDSVFTMGTLLSILLSKFDSEDFYIALPLKFCTVLVSVYYATAFTVLGCVQALNVENIFMDKDVWWLIFLLMLLGWYMTLIVFDICYCVFDYVYYFIRYSFLYKRENHVM